MTSTVVSIVRQPTRVITVARTVGPPGPPGQSGDAGTLLDHIDDLSPHPAYDDMPSLTLLFENGII